MRKILTLSVAVLLLLSPVLSMAQSVLTSDDTSSKKLDPAIEKYVQQVVVITYLNEITDLTRRVVESHEFPILPQIIKSSIYYVGLEAYKQSVISGTIRDAYYDGIDIAQDAVDNGNPNAEVDIKQAVDGHIEKIVDTPLFRKIVEEVIRQSLNQQQQINNEVARQQYIAQITARQKLMQEAINQKFQQAYQDAYQSNLKESGIWSSQ